MPRWRQRGSVPLCPANINKGATSPGSTGCMRDPWDLLRNADRSGLEPPCRQTTAFGGRIPTAMRKREGYKSGIELLQGTLDMLILQTLRRGPQHGYGIGQAIRSGSGEVLQAETGSLRSEERRVGKECRSWW